VSPAIALSMRRIAYVLCAGMMLLLVACGGGGDDNPAPPPVTAPSGLSYTSPANLTIGAEATALSPTVTGTVTSYTVGPALPTGLTLNGTTGVISGTPTVLTEAADYTITATNSAGSTTFALSLSVVPPTASAYSQTNLVSNGTVAGTQTDPKLVNPWGLAFGATSPAWLANNGSQTSTVYDGTGAPRPIVVAIPPGTNGPADPTGIVANASSGFNITVGSNTAPARFIFAGEGGTISGWAPTVDAANAITVYDDGGGNAGYTGLAIADNAGAGTLYASDFRNGKIDVFDQSFQKITATGGFTDSDLPTGYAPFGIQAVTLDTTTVIVVAYAKRDETSGDEVVGEGLGVVNVFDLNGTLIRHLVTEGGHLNAPWGVAKAPATFGSLANMLLIGNFGDGVINGFDPVSGVFAGSINDSAGTPLANPGLWGMAFGNGAQNQPAGTLYFAAGIGDEAAGLYGRIDLGANGPDAKAPIVALTAPAAGTISGTVTLTADASDDVGVAQVNFLVTAGGTTTTIGSDTSAPFSIDFDTATVANGAATLMAQALDAAGNSTTSAAVAVTVDNTAPAVTLAQLQSSIFTPRCSSCHTGGGSSLPASMNLSSESATRAALVGVASIEVPSLQRVAPGDPANSYLIHKLEGTQSSGSRMPLGGPFLDQATIDSVKAWIQAGAQ